MIAKKEVEKVAKLARLKLTEEEVKKFQKELSLILKYFEKLRELEVEEIEPTSHSILVENVMREDEKKPRDQRTEKARNLLDLAPEIKKGYLKVKKII